MGHAREKVKNLPVKLRQIRKYLNFSQNEMVRFMKLEDKLTREDISKFERGVREPSLSVLLCFARAVEISTDVLIDDDLKLPF